MQVASSQDVTLQISTIGAPKSFQPVMCTQFVPRLYNVATVNQ